MNNKSHTTTSVERPGKRAVHHRWLAAILRCLVVAVFLLGPAYTPAQAQGPGPCNANHLHYGLISVNESWCPGEIHYLTDDVTVQHGVTLTIAAGVTVQSAGDRVWKYLIVQGHLDVNGTQAQPVKLSGETLQPNCTWGGLYFDGSAGDGSGTIQYTTIEYAGSNLGGYGGAQHAVLIKDLPAGKQVTISHTTIRNNVAKGVYIVNSAASLTDDTFSGNKYPVYIEGASSTVTFSGNSFANNAYPYYGIGGPQYTVNEDAVFLTPEALMGHNFTLPVQTGLDAYVFMQGAAIPSGRTVGVAPGSTLRVGDGALSVKGRLDAVGLPAQPIKITGIPGSDTDIWEWDGLVFDGREGGGTGRLDYVTLEHAAENMTEYGPYALLVRDTPAGGQALVEHSTIQDNREIGVRVVNGSLALNSSTIRRNRIAMIIDGAASKAPLTGNTFSDNTYNLVYLSPGAMTSGNIDLSLQTGLEAYFFTDTFTLPAGRTLTVRPGVRVRTASSKFLVIQGDLQAIGAAGQPVTFSDPNESGATWGGLIFDGPSGASGHLANAVVENGCAHWNGNLCATLLIYQIAAGKAVLVERSVIRNSGDWVLGLVNSPTAQVDGNLISAGRVGVYIAGNSTVKNLAIIDPLLDGVIIENGAAVDARHLTVARAGRSGVYVHTGGSVSLKNSILSHNPLAVWAEGSGQAALDTNLSDANTTFKSGAVTDAHSLSGVAAFAADGYHLLPGSAAAGLGLPRLCAVDIDGQARPQPSGSLPDLGADEITNPFSVFLPLVVR